MNGATVGKATAGRCPRGESVVAQQTVRDVNLLGKQGLQPGPEVRDDVTRELRAGSFTASPDEMMADVPGGVVAVASEVRYKSTLPLVLAAIRAVARVVDVEGYLRYAVDDTRVPAKPGSMP
jgi:hypothetical protein